MNWRKNLELSFGALNALSTTEDSSFGYFYEVRQEEQEAEALQMYNEALRFHCNDQTSSAEKLFLAVLQTDLIIQAPESIPEGENLPDSPALFLKYNVLKILASIYEKLQDNEKALDFYLHASIVDESDVNLWLTIASIAKKTLNIRLERFAYEKGLIYSPNNWTCLDNLISTLYILGDYAACLALIDKAFERNEDYVKGHAFRDQIFKEEPHFKKDCMKLEFLFTDDQFNSSAKYQEYIEEALVIRGKRTLSAKHEEIPQEKFTKPLSHYTWINFGECLLSLYTELTTRVECKSLAASIDLLKHCKTKEQQNGLLIPSAEVLIKKGYKEFENKKRRKLSGQEAEPQPKRRSARVKTSKRKEIDVNWSDLISSFLPTSLKTEITTDTDCSQDSLTDSNPGKLMSQANNIEAFKKEAVAVSDFINSKVSNDGCIDLFGSFLFAVIKFYEQQPWQLDLSSVFVSIYKSYRKHVSWPNLFSAALYTETETADLGKMLLVALEIELEQLMERRDFTASPVSSPLKASLSNGKLILATEFLTDFHYLSMLGANNSILANEDLDFRTRFYWLQARYCIMQNEITEAVNALNNCTYTLSMASIDEIIIPNCSRENVINHGAILKKLECVQQSQTLEELQLIFAAGRYEEVIVLLNFALDEKIDQTSLITERPLQLVLLLESYLKTGQFRKCIDCCLIAFNEAVVSGSVADLWKNQLNRLLMLLYNCFSDEVFHFDCLGLKDKQIFTDNFIKIIEISMSIEQPESECISTLPWVLIHKLLKFESSCLNFEPKSLNSNHTLIEFLRTAHEYLGRKHWCCNDKGLFLQYFIKEIQEMNNHALSPHEKETLNKDMEQCFFCLYGDPCRKSKSKLLFDHNVTPITLSWSNAKVLYDFYKPAGLPQFDLRANTISLEVQNVFRKIVAVVPKKEIEVIPFEVLVLYIEGGGDFPEPVNKENEMPDLFYYLGDFYFKNKEFSKALKFYMHDVSINPDRFQSWAAMALARGSRLEEKINQCDLKSDGVMRKHITTTLRCFEKAVTIDNKKCVILEEYGQTAYMLNSYASRRLREVTQEKKHDLSTNEFYFKMKKEMLLLSIRCFNEALHLANSWENELWLHYYMLGKASEKLEQPPDEYLEFYQKSLQELYKNGGRFQKRIPYHGAAEYSIEVVELFFQIHASIINLLIHKEIVEFDILEKHLNAAFCQPIYQNFKDVDNVVSKDVDEIALEVNLLIKDILVEIESNLICFEKNDSKTDSTISYNEKLQDDDLNQTVSSCSSSRKKTVNSELQPCFQSDELIVESLLSDLIQKVSGENVLTKPQKSQTNLTNNDILSKNLGNEQEKLLENCLLSTAGNTLVHHNFKSQEDQQRYKNIAQKCLDALAFCLRRFPEHYKSRYLMAYFFMVDKEFKNIQWSRSLLLGNGIESSMSFNISSNGIISSKKKTNLFQYLWRIPVNEVDRPGSFLSHVCCIVKLLLDILYQLGDTYLLLHVAAFLHKTPDKDRKYLHDNDRAFLAIKAFDFLLDVLKGRLNKVCLDESGKKKLFSETCAAFKHSQKLQVSTKTAEYLLVESYVKMHPDKANMDSELVLEEAIKVCHQS